jgi:hypothetical protein
VDNFIFLDSRGVGEFDEHGEEPDFHDLPEIDDEDVPF